MKPLLQNVHFGFHMLSFLVPFGGWKKLEPCPFWCLLGVKTKLSDEHPRPFPMGVRFPLRLGLRLRLRKLLSCTIQSGPSDPSASLPTAVIIILIHFLVVSGFHFGVFRTKFHKKCSLQAPPSCGLPKGYEDYCKQQFRRGTCWNRTARNQNFQFGVSEMWWLNV